MGAQRVDPLVKILQGIGILLIESGSRKTIFSLLRVSKKFHDTFLPLFYQQCTLDFTETKATRIERRFRPDLDTQLVLRGFLEKTPRNTIITQSIRKLIIRSTSADKRVDDSGWSNVAELIPRITNLQELVFDCLEPVPMAVLTTLEKHHPHSHLYIHNWTRKSRDTKVGDPLEELLARSSCLRGIQAVFEISNYQPMDLNEAALGRIIARAPNIESASMKVRFSDDWSRSLKMTRADYSEQERERARFDVKGHERRVFKRLGWSHMRPDSIALLEKIAVLSELKALDGGLFYYVGFRHAIEHATFQGLTELSFTIPEREPAEDGDVSRSKRQSAVMSFLRSLRPLESLSITRYTDFIDVLSLLQHHGTALRSLTLHEVEVPSHIRPVLTIASLNHICTHATNLKLLTIDINRTVNTKAENRVYEALSSFRPRLTKLTLCYDLGLGVLRNAPDNRGLSPSPAHEDPTSAFAKEVWESLTHGSSPSGLQFLTLVFGEQRARDMSPGFPDRWVDYEGYARRKYEVARKSEMDGEVFVKRHWDVTDAQKESELRLSWEMEATIPEMLYGSRGLPLPDNVQQSLRGIADDLLKLHGYS